MRLEVLISCMYERDFSIVRRTNIQTDVVVINQCDKDSVVESFFVNKDNERCRIKFINTTERGLSRSRNLAINSASADVCLICDDDEELCDNYEEIILDAFKSIPTADIVAFNLERPSKKPFTSIHKLSGFEAYKVSSVHIAFRLNSVLDKKICFDVMLGSGSGNGGGEDTRFMRDCRNKGLEQWGHTSYIGILKDTGNSRWFHGYNKQFFIDSGWTTRRVFGDAISIAKLLHFTIKHWKEYRADVSLFDALRYSFIGWRMKK